MPDNVVEIALKLRTDGFKGQIDQAASAFQAAMGRVNGSSTAASAAIVKQRAAFGGLAQSVSGIATASDKMTDASQKLGSIDAFAKLKTETVAAEGAWKSAQRAVASFAKDIKSAASTTSVLSKEYERAKAAAALAAAELKQLQAEMKGLKAPPTDLVDRLSEAKTASAGAKAEMMRLGQELKKTSSTSSELSNKFDQSKSSAADAKAAFADKRAQLEKLRRTMAASGVDASNLSETQARLKRAMMEVASAAERQRERLRQSSRIDRASGLLGGIRPERDIAREISLVEAAYKRLAASGRYTAADLARAHSAMQGRVQELNRELTGGEPIIARLQRGFYAISAAAATLATIAFPVKAAIEFESVMADVKKVVDFPTSTGFSELTTQIKEMGRAIPLPLEGIARIAEAAGQMGVKSKDIEGFVTVVAKMATAFKLSTDEAGASIGKLMNIFSLSVPQVEALGDTINHLGNNTNAVERDIINVLQRVGGMAKVFGLSTEQTAGLSAAFLALGRPPEIAATGINALLSILQTAPTREADFKEAMLAVGISAEEMARRIAANPQQALMDFLDTLSKLDSQTMAESLVKIFGRQYQDDLAILIAGLGKYRETLGLATDKTRQAGSMQREFDERLKTTKAQLQLTANGFTELGINIGNAFLPMLNLAARAVGGLVNGINTLIEKFPATATLAIQAVTALLTIGGAGAAWKAAGGIMAGVIGAVTGAIARFGGAASAALAVFSVSPWGRAIKVLAAVGATLAVGYAAITDASASAVPAMQKTVEETGKEIVTRQKQVKTLEELRQSLLASRDGTEEHIAAEARLAELVPGVTKSIDDQGRVLAKGSKATDDNIKVLDRYIRAQRKSAEATVVRQIMEQSDAVRTAGDELQSYRDSLAAMSIEGGELGWMDKVRAFFGGLPTDYQGVITQGNDLRSNLKQTQGQLKGLVEGAVKAGVSVEEFGAQLGALGADPAQKRDLVALFKATTDEAAKAILQTEQFDQRLGRIAVSLKGPADRVKGVLVNAITAADHQLQSTGTSINTARQKLTGAIDEVGKSWRAMADTAANSQQQALDRIGQRYNDLRLQIDQQAAAGVTSERDRIAQSIRLMVDETRERVRVQADYQTKALALVRQEYTVRMEHARRLGTETARVDTDRLVAIRNVLQQTQTAYRSHIDALINEERRHLQEAIAIEQARKGLKQTVEDQIRALRQRTMGEVEKAADQQRAIEEERIKAEAALRDGDYEAAQRHSERMRQMAGDAAGDDRVSVTRAIEQITDAARIADQAMQQQQHAHKRAANEAQAEYRNLTKALEDVGRQIADINREITVDHQIVFDVDSQKITEAAAELDVLLRKRDDLVRLKNELRGAVEAVATLPTAVGAGNALQLADSMERVNAAFTTLKGQLTGWDPEIAAKFAVGDAGAQIENLGVKVTDAKTKMEAFKPVAGAVAEAIKAIPPATITADNSQALQTIRDTEARLAAMPDKEVVVRVRTEEAHAAGGWAGISRRFPGYAMGGTVRSMMAGGRLPGPPSTRDTIPAMLAAGEYVVRANRAARFAPLLEAINSGSVTAIQRMLARWAATLPRFAAGGVVSSYIPSIPSIPGPAAAMPGGGGSTMRLELSIPGLAPHERPIQLSGDAGELRRLDRLLRQANRGRG